MLKKIIFWGIGLTVFGISGTSYAQLEARCRQDDQLSIPDAVGRNAWARKCGYVSISRESSLNEEHEYQVFDRACATYPTIPVGSDCQRRVPVLESEACIGGLAKLGTCIAGCYTPTQKVTFGGTDMTIEQALNAGKKSVTALVPGSSQRSPQYQEQALTSYVKGETQEDIFLLETAGGARLEVTSEHPMVNGRGEIVRAKTLKVGDQLMRRDGSLVALSRVSVFNFKGTVWNVKPTSERQMDNILVAEGFLTGSVRFQNEWANQSYRLSLRDEVDASAF